MEGVAAIIAQADDFARRLREWDDRRVELQIAEGIEQERKTIDIRVEQASDEKLNQKLQGSREWLDQQERKMQVLATRREQIQSFVGWAIENTGNFAKNWILLLSLVGAGVLWGGFLGINFPSAVVCQSHFDLCYLLRIRELKTAADISETQCAKAKSGKGFVCTVPDTSGKSSSKQTKH